MPLITLEAARERFRLSIDCDCEDCVRGVARRHGYTLVSQTAMPAPQHAPAQAILIPDRMNKFICKMGVELEGAWEDGSPQNLTHDGSVTVSGAYRGESVSPAYSRFDQLTKYINRNYPDSVNESCGLHVHFSFNSLSFYMRLMEPAFDKFFHNQVEKWAKVAIPKEDRFWYRFAGRNTYCKNEWHADKQARVRGKGGPRYSRWNFCHGLHQTAECRLLPCFSQADTSIQAVRMLKNVVLLWLRDNVKKPLEGYEAQLPILGTDSNEQDNQPETIKEEICV